MYALTKSKVTSIFSCDAVTFGCEQVYSDANVKMKLMPRNGGGDLANVIQVARRRAFAVGNDGSSAGVLCQLSLDGSNQMKQVAPIDSAEPIDWLAVDKEGKRVVYASLNTINKSGEEGDSFSVDKLVIQNTAKRDDKKTINSKIQIGSALISYLGFGRKDDNVYVRVDRSDGPPPQDRLFRIERDDLFHGLPYELNVSKNVAGQLPDGKFAFVTNNAVLPQLQIENESAKVVRTVQLHHDGVFYALAPNSDLMALHVYVGDSLQEIWVKDLKSGNEKRALKITIDEKKGTHFLTLVGWMGDSH